MSRVPTTIVLSALFALPAGAQKTELKFIADTIVVEAEGTYEAEPDLATLTFDISSQDKELKRAYEIASKSMRVIADLADRSGLKKEEVKTGTLTVSPSYERDRKGNAKSYRVNGRMTLKVRDFSQIGPLMDNAVQEGIVDFRSLTYSLSDEEAAKQRAAGEAMRRAVGRATAALSEKGQKLGLLRFASLDVRQLVGVSSLYAMPLVEMANVTGGGSGQKASVPPPAPAQPENIRVSATVQCAFQIQ